MDRGDLQRLTKDELIELVLGMQHPEKTSLTSSKPPSTDRPQYIIGTRIYGSGYWRRSMTPSSCHIHSKLYVAIGSAGLGCREDWFSRYFNHSAIFCRPAVDFAA